MPKNLILETYPKKIQPVNLFSKTYHEDLKKKNEPENPLFTPTLILKSLHTKKIKSTLLTKHVTHNKLNLQRLNLTVTHGHELIQTQP